MYSPTTVCTGRALVEGIGGLPKSPSTNHEHIVFSHPFSPSPLVVFLMNLLLPGMFLRLTTNYVIKIQNYHNNTNTQPTLHRCQSAQKNMTNQSANTQCLLVAAAFTCYNIVFKMQASYERNKCCKPSFVDMVGE